ncbi:MULTISPECIES: fasciclin domain-containing protein [unclassified Aeromicrobium]|uniref:fasciclin domain-containing protein n=2 Tax=Aeromicrobium TaxID=2040 RepID=UPI000701BA89|nr:MULTISPECIES: fasciclin domain-containing protein [unclassified Aeromicrobium]KQO36700.1 fasciclin [Aeromicrobium sp. Leaf245]KQP78073.1 fasciclin [Aeromicrobium sp. Leaf289]KQP83798.1 fasciclin [Aeromicrobium sp. Leaf291]
MRTTTKSKTLAITAVASLSLFTAACGSSDDDAASSSDNETSAPASEDASDAGSDLVGPGCADYAAQVPDGAGSVEGMAQDPVATAASNNPLLKTLVAAVSGELNPDVNLVDTLNGGEFTVFAPVDDAFGKLPEETVKTLGTPEGAKTLESVLTYHVIPNQIAPADIDGTFKTVNGAELTITGEGDNIRVGDQAGVICGGVKTANATVYLIDTVLMPPA